MNIVLLEPQEIDARSVRLDGRRAKHIAKVLRSQVGDSIRIGIINGKMGYGIIKEISRRQPCSVLVELELTEEPPPAPPIDIVLALPRPIMFRRILSQATALGIGHLYVVNASRVEKSYWQASVTDEPSWREHLLQGLEQAVDTRLPAVTFHKGFKPFIESTLPEIRDHYRAMLSAHPGGTTRLADVLKRPSGRILVAVGPEGGWIDYELERMREAGFTVISLGPRILKVDTAVTALHAMVSLLAGA